MSVLINGMDMPKNDSWVNVKIKEKDGKPIIAFITGEDLEGKYFEIEEIPTPHGRLIDADKLLALVEKEVNNTCIGCEPEPDDCCAYDRFKEIISEIKTAQTIIEAEVSE